MELVVLFLIEKLSTPSPSSIFPSPSFQNVCENDDSLIILDLAFTTNKKEVTINYRLIAIIPHPDKFDD